MTIEWTGEQQDMALAEGWGIFDVSPITGPNFERIERWDEADIFTSDGAALEHVQAAALNEHQLAIDALAYLKEKTHAHR